MNKRIVFTRGDGGVSVYCPHAICMAWMSYGGIWDAFPRGFIDEQIARQVASGIPEWAAARFAKAVQFGGCTTAEALEILRDRDCAPYGTGCELWDVADVPTDRWFRNAWRRSPNGGPIYIAIHPAQSIQFKRARDFVTQENKRRDEFDGLAAHVSVDWQAFRQKLIRISDLGALRHAMPDELS